MYFVLNEYEQRCAACLKDDFIIYYVRKFTVIVAAATVVEAYTHTYYGVCIVCFDVVDDDVVIFKSKLRCFCIAIVCDGPKS